MSRSSAAKTRSSPDIRPPSSIIEEGPLAVGTLVAGKYEVVRKLAEGGLGIVVLAVHRELNQRVAIKYLKPEALAVPALVARFHREARLAASLHSEHVVRVFDVGRHRRAGPYMVMEYLEGSDLASVMNASRLEVTSAVDYVLQACDALAEAHSRGIVHRDLKPENLFLARRGTRGTIVKVVDFGLSKVTVPSGQSGSFPRLTEQGERFGTPMFMSPEQLACSADVDARSDIWALGVVLFELLTSELPFDGVTAATLAANIFSAAPRELRALRPDASPELEAVVRRCLAKDPAGRYRDIESLAADLVAHGPAGSSDRLDAIRRALRVGSMQPPRNKERLEKAPPPRPSRRRTGVFTAGALLAAAALMTGFVVRHELAHARLHESATMQKAANEPTAALTPLASPQLLATASSEPAPVIVPIVATASPQPRARAAAPREATATPPAPAHSGDAEEWDIRHTR